MPRHSDFVHLHLHSEYSLLDGAIMIKELVETASAMRMPAVAITDHGNLFGAVEFYKKATKAGIKPIIGCEIYVAPKSRFDKEKSASEESSFHLVLIAKNSAGYRNLVTLVSKAYTEGFYYKPRIDRQLLEQHSGGLIALTSCMKGEISYYLMKDMKEAAREAALTYKRIMGPDNFYIELQANGIKEQEQLNERLADLASELHIGVVATNDCHYMKKEDARAHDILLCIQTGKTVNSTDRLRMSTDELYFKSPEEMKAALGHIPGAIENTIKIAEMCSLEFKLGEILLPKYTPDDGSSPSEFLKRLAKKGLREKFGPEPEEKYTERLGHELSVIEKMGYESYFLIVWDFVNFAKQKGIPVGPGRGSAAGSLVSYALGITEIDPLKYNLLFERFLNPERISMPDIDVDFCKDRRADVIEYVSEKYGHDHVAQIITFGTMAAKAAIRDVGRALDFPYQEVDRIAKLVPNTLNIKIEEALRLEPQIRNMYDENPKIKELLDIAKRLEGLARHASTHAAGIVISPMPLTEMTPLYKNPSDGSITTQFDMGSIESLGLIKFDLLGLKTLTLIEKTLAYIRENGMDISLKDIPLNDKETYELLTSGHTTGVFQLESRGMKDILVKMSPNRFEDLIALVALYRPGPLGSGMIDDFIKRKKGEVPFHYDMPELKDSLDETYGVILYQEQVMSIANRVANFTMGQADILRKAMGKKRPEEMEKQKEAFVQGAINNGIPEKKARKLFDLMAFFAEYGFNKSHSAAYAYLSYQTAYLKAHCPVEFMAATMSSDLDNTDKIVKSIKECRNMSIDILPPDINLSGKEFTIVGSSIRFGLGAVKGVGAAAIDAILEAREKDGKFDSPGNFLKRVDTKRVNKKVIEALVKAGAFDSASEDISGPAIKRSKALEALENPNGSSPSLNLFGGAEEAVEAEGWDEATLLRCEKEALGFYLTGNPLSKYREHISSMNLRNTAELEELEDRQEVEVAAMLHNIRKLRTRDKSEIMASLTLEDEDGSAEAIVFPELYRANSELLKKDAALLVKGTLDKTEKGNKIIAKEITGLDDLVKTAKEGMKVEITIRCANGRADLRKLRDAVSAHKGQNPLYLKIFKDKAETLILTGLHVHAGGGLVNSVEEVLGKGTVRIS
jgi:DNA polymerase-3 subunit alpha